MVPKIIYVCIKKKLGYIRGRSGEHQEEDTRGILYYKQEIAPHPNHLPLHIEREISDEGHSR